MLLFLHMEAPALLDGRRERGRRTRESILDTAVQLASVEGLDGITIGRLASELGMSKSGLFAHFGSKEELQLATIDTAREIFVETIITPAQIGVLPSLEMVIWVAVGGRGTLAGAVVGAVSVNWGRSVLTSYFPELWPFILGGLFVVVVLLFPDGLIGIMRQARERIGQIRAKATALPEEELG